MRKRIKNSHPWFKSRGYLHFDLVISQSKAEIISASSAVEKHQFLPLIHYFSSKPRFNFEHGRLKEKKRPIMYASHRDSAVFSKYKHTLDLLYENKLIQLGIGESVLAYRRILLGRKGKTNIDFAFDVFKHIHDFGPCTAIALDIRGFFDHLSHSKIKAVWKSLLDVSELPKDHYNVYRAVTKYCFVERDELETEFKLKDKHRALRKARKSGTPYRDIPIKDRVVCLPSKLRKLHNLSLVTIKQNDGSLNASSSIDKGIPQDLPISASLSNYYMLDFDTLMCKLIGELGGKYFRYSDDILLIVPSNCEEEITVKCINAIKQRGLEIAEDKKHIRVFHPTPDKGILTDQPLKYLGFEFDGRSVMLRSESINKYLGRMKRRIYSIGNQAIRMNTYAKSNRIRKQKLYNDYSHLGVQGFYQYARDAHKAFKKGPWRVLILRQLRKHWSLMERHIRHVESRLYKRRVSE